MTMRKQPEGAKRRKRGDAKPAQEYDILLEGKPIGYTQRAEKGKWRAFPVDAEGNVGAVWPTLFDNHTLATEHLVSVKRGLVT